MVSYACILERYYATIYGGNAPTVGDNAQSVRANAKMIKNVAKARLKTCSDDDKRFMLQQIIRACRNIRLVVRKDDD